MSGMAEVLHGLRVPYGGRENGYIHIDANAAHAIAAALTAAGFGPVKEAAAEVTEAQWQEASEMADPLFVAQPYTEDELREAAAKALEDAADDIRTGYDCGNHYNPSACETCSAVAVLGARAAAVRGEG